MTVNYIPIFKMKFCLSFVALFFLFQFSFSQEKTPFNDYWKLGVTGMYSSHKSSNEANGLDFKIENINVPSLGLKYNFYQFNNYNLSASLQHYRFQENYKYEWLAEDNPEGYDIYFHNTFKHTEMEQLTLNLMIDKYFPLKNNYLIVGAGPEIRLLQSFRGKSTTGYGYGDDIDNNTINILETFTDSETDFNFGIRADTGIGLTSGIGLFELRLHGHLGFTKFLKGTATVDNLLVSPSSNTNYSVSGSYLGASLSYFPKRKNKKM